MLFFTYELQKMSTSSDLLTATAHIPLCVLYADMDVKQYIHQMAVHISENTKHGDGGEA